MLEDLGNCVKIHDTVIPAVNIQVEGFPKFVDDVWYGIYFEVLFEDGTLWEIEQRHSDLPVTINIYPNWGCARNSGPVMGYMNGAIVGCKSNWADFLELYRVKKFMLGQNIKYHWLGYSEWMAA